MATLAFFSNGGLQARTPFDEVGHRLRRRLLEQ
jgi:hypothetical protein